MYLLLHTNKGFPFLKRISICGQVNVQSSVRDSLSKVYSFSSLLKHWQSLFKLFFLYFLILLSIKRKLMQTNIQPFPNLPYCNRICRYDLLFFTKIDSFTKQAAMPSQKSLAFQAARFTSFQSATQWLKQCYIFFLYGSTLLMTSISLLAKAQAKHLLQRNLKIQDLELGRRIVSLINL